MNTEDILNEYEALRNTIVYLIEETKINYDTSYLKNLQFTDVISGSKEILAILNTLPFEAYVIDESFRQMPMQQFVYELLNSYNPSLDNTPEIIKFSPTCGCPKCVQGKKLFEEQFELPVETIDETESIFNINKVEKVPVERIQNTNTHFEQFLADEVHKFYDEDVTLQEFCYLLEVAPLEQRQPLLDNLSSLMNKMKQKIETETPTVREQMKLLYKIARR